MSHSQFFSSQLALSISSELAGKHFIFSFTSAFLYLNVCQFWNTFMSRFSADWSFKGTFKTRQGVDL
ncbi:hypothetical protein BDN67DRAFT_961389 [Paxillus ammoniavirescens]|nr:hypothetical protein BDN67DRAFT_961389 [Paxillus ammoniavirescens]